MKKQMTYADKKGIRYVAILGESELKEGVLTLKDMQSGEQKTVKPEEVQRLLQR